MLRLRLLMVVVAAMGATVSPLSVGSAQGQSVGGLYYETYRYGYNPSYYARRYPTPPVFVAPSKWVSPLMPYMYYVSAPEAVSPKRARVLAFEVRVPPNAGIPALSDTSAQIDLQVPAGAQVWIGGERTAQTGPLRQFMTPPLTPGREYTYEIRATWKEGGREVTENRRITFVAGGHVSASFPSVPK